VRSALGKTLDVGRTCADALCAVEEQERKNRHIPLGLNIVVIFPEISEQRVVAGVEDRARDWRWLRKDITCGSMVLSALVTRTVLSVRQQQIQVIAPDVILREIDDRHRQTLLAVVIRRMFGDISDELRDLGDK
jgi:hypothetical protein